MSEVSRAHPVARLLTRPWFWLLAIGLLFGVPLGRSLTRAPPKPLPVLAALPDFALQDEQGRPFHRHDLDGKVWAANFVFVNCPGVCPRLSEKMAKVQHRVRHLGPTARLVTFTVDPERDTPAALLDYAKRYHYNPRVWSFVTGPLGAMQDAVVKGFRIAMSKEAIAPDLAPEFFEIIHGEHFVLVDQRGRIRGYYGAEDDAQNALVADYAMLVNVPDTPTGEPKPAAK